MVINIVLEGVGLYAQSGFRFGFADILTAFQGILQQVDFMNNSVINVNFVEHGFIEEKL